MRIYVACLASYNNGVLHGRWIDATRDADTMRADVADMLKASPMPDAEEFAIHDSEGLGGAGEYESLDAIAERVAMAEAIEEAGLPVDVAREALDGAGIDDASEAGDWLSEHYSGCFDSEEDWAAEFMAGTMEIPDHLANYIDYAAYARDCRLSGDVDFVRHGGSVYVFCAH